jgi:hypothetical protein
LTAAAVLGAVSFGPIVRALVRAEGARRRLDVTVGGVRPSFFGVRLLGLDVRPSGLDSCRVHVGELALGLGVSLGIARIDADGVQVSLTGSARSLLEDWRRWVGPREPAEGTGRPSAILKATKVAVHWVDPGSPVWGADLRNLTVSRDFAGTRLALGDGQLRLGAVTLDVAEAAAELSPSGLLLAAQATTLDVALSTEAESARLSTGATPAELPPTPPPAVAAPAARSGRHQRPAPPAPAEAGAPLVPLPDLRGARGKAALVADLLAARVKPGARISVDSLTWKVARDAEGVALTFGPGPLSFTRAPAELDLDYSTDKRAGGTALSLRAVLPNDRGDIVVTAEGGPAPLSLLGVKEGAAGLVDVDRARVAGRGRLVLAGDGSALTFDAESSAHNLSINQPRLATETVRGLDLALRVRGAITVPGEVRLDDFGATLGALQVHGSGVLDQEPDRVAAAVQFEIPAASCQSLVDSIPAALVPTLAGAAMSGTFAAHGRFAFDTRSLDDLELVYQTQDGCRLVRVGPELDPDRFTRPFSHRVYLPDGSLDEETTGPGTPSWTPLDQISPYMLTAVLTTEDGAFPKHHGFNHAAIRASIIANLKARRFVRGASTITMQLAKNLFLSRDKTLSRKLEEIVLTDYLEQTFSKSEILELYFNVIEFGPDVYGVGAASDYYFGRQPAELNLAECLFLASVLPAPLRHASMHDGDRPPDGWMRNLRSLMDVERQRGLITESERTEAESEEVVFWHGGPRPPPRGPVSARAPAAGSDLDVGDPFEAGF